MPAKGYRKPSRDRRSKCFTFWVTPAEKDAIQQNAERVGMTPSAYVRALALGQRVTPKPGKSGHELIRQLSRVGNNLNQLLRHADGGQVLAAPLEAARVHVLAALRHWSAGNIDRSPAPELVAEIVHQGALLNDLARQANRKQVLDPAMVETVLASLTEAVRRVAPVRDSIGGGAPA